VSDTVLQLSHAVVQLSDAVVQLSLCDKVPSFDSAVAMQVHASKSAVCAFHSGISACLAAHKKLCDKVPSFDSAVAMQVRASKSAVCA
jgi:hypothetical protein